MPGDPDSSLGTFWVSGLYELATTVDTNLAMVDVACISANGGAGLITHGLTEDEEKIETQRPGHGVRRLGTQTFLVSVRAKLVREASFPMEIAEAGLQVQLERSEERFRISWLSSVTGLGRWGQSLDPSQRCCARASVPASAAHFHLKVRSRGGLRETLKAFRASRCCVQEQRKLENAEIRLRSRLATTFWPRVALPDKDFTSF